VKILYAGTISKNDTSLHRMWALERIGQTCIPFNSLDYVPANSLLAKITHRAAMGPHVSRMNRDLLALAKAERPDILWADKLLWLRPSTLEALRRMGIVTVSYMIDNAFGARKDPGWRLYRKDIPYFDLHVVQRDKNIEQYKESGARDVIKIQTAYEPTLQYPPPAGWSDADRDRGVSFIGTPYDKRAEFLTRLWKEFGLPVAVNGNKFWKRDLSPEAYEGIFRKEGELYRDAYREAIWRSRINLSFITHSNHDEFVHKSFEIAGCGAFLLAERSQGHLDRFKEDEEAVFFSDFEECVAKIKRYLPDEAARTRIAAAGHARAERDGYYNDRQVALVAERAESILRRMRAEA
jgi:spore maturation protein CgeB